MARVMPTRPAGTVARVSGPLIEVTGVPGVSMLELIEIGGGRINCETVAVAGERATLQAYEYTGGLSVGDVAQPTGSELLGLLGPGLLGQVFDGLLRPLSSAGLWLTPDRQASTSDTATLAREWTFVATVTVGAQLKAGDILGTVPHAGSVEHRVLVPYGVSGPVEWLATDAVVHALDVEGGVGLGVAQPLRVFQGGVKV